MKITLNEIQDDLGFWWLFEDGKIRLPEADADCTYEEDGELYVENGYYCDSFAEGVAFLIKERYITRTIEA